MTIPFKNVPTGLRVPLFYGELDPSRANTSTQTQRTLIVGQMVASGTATPNVPVQALGAAKALAGAGSVLAIMAAIYAQNDPSGEVWLLPLSDDPGATAASGTITFTGTTTAAGTLALYIAATPVNFSPNGAPQPLQIAIASGQTAAQIAATVATAINANLDLPVSAAAVGGVVTLTADNKGLVGNDIDVRINYLGTAGGEALPVGITVTIVPMAGGATNPQLTAALTNLQDEPFDFIVCSLTDAVSTAAIKSLLNDQTGRWSWLSQVYGHAFYALRATTGIASTWATALNDQHAAVMPFPESPSPAWAFAAALAGASAVSLRADPGMPLQTLTLQGVFAPALASRWPLVVRNQLLYSGCSTFKVDAGGTISLENVITTYVVSSQGQPDNSYLEIETMFLLVYILRTLQSLVATKYGRVKLAADGTRVLPGTPVVTPSIIKADLIAKYREMEAGGFTQQSDVFAAGLDVEKDSVNPNRVNVLYPAILIDQLRIFAALVQFRLQ